jgi:hypothetical protein
MSLNPAALDGFRITLPTVGQKEMRLAGPMVPASWYIPAELEKQLQSQGKPVPPPVAGHLLLDTGAAQIAIDNEVAKSLGLKPVKTAMEGQGIKGFDEMECYYARLLLPVLPIQNARPLTVTPVMIGIPIEQVWETTGMMANYIKWGYETSPGVPLKVIGILGRLFLQFTKVTFNGLTGATEIEIDKSCMYPKTD